MYEYPAKLIRVVDGDTVDLRVDLGFRMHLEDRFRLFGINAYEMYAKDDNERELAQKGKELLDHRLQHAKEIRITTIAKKKGGDKQGKYGRFLAIVYADNVHLNDLLVEKKLAKVNFYK